MEFLKSVNNRTHETSSAVKTGQYKNWKNPQINPHPVSTLKTSLFSEEK
jgi:hypothetical protein